MSLDVQAGIALVAASFFAFAPAVVSAQPEEGAAPEEAPAAEEPAPEPEPEVEPFAEPEPEPEEEPFVEPEPEPEAEPAPEPEPAAAVPAAAAEAPEEILVTGTRIKRKGIATAAPISVLSREDLLNSGMVSVGEILQNLPSQSNALNVNFNNGGNGATRVNMRGLDAKRTLVLVNGRRHVAGGDGADSSVDLNAIPMAVIERVEVLKDGASAIYGSDAIGGVVNIITRTDFDGAEATGYTGITQRGDGEVYDLSATVGVTTTKGSIMFSAGFYEQRPIWAGDRDFADTDREYDFDPDFTGSDDERVYDNGSTATPQSHIVDQGGACVFYGTQAECVADSLCAWNDSDDDPDNHYCTEVGNSLWQSVLNPVVGSGGTCDSGDCYLDPTTGVYRDFNYAGASDQGTGDLYNYQPENYLLTPQRRYHLWTSGHYDFSQWVTGYFEGSYSNRRSDQKLAPEPFFTLFSSIPGITVSADQYYNPYGREFIDIRRRMVEQSNRIFRQDINTFRGVLGLRGPLPELGPIMDWEWDASMNIGRTEGINTNEGQFVVSRLRRALGSAADCTDDCVQLNLFGGPGSITQDMLDYVSYTGTARGWTEQRSLQLNVSGPIYELVVNNPIALALGYEYRREAGSLLPDPITVARDTTGTAQDATKGKYSVNAGYAELSIPVVGGLPGVELLELLAAVRAFDYDTFDSSATYKVGARWQIMDFLAARGTYSTAFRAPTVSELYGGSTDSYPNVADPCGDPTPGSDAERTCSNDGVINTDSRTQLLAKVGGNPNLVNETANIVTGGLVLEPTLVKGLSAALDYWRVEVDEAIQPVGAGIILSSCYSVANDADRRFCELIERDPDTNLIVAISDEQKNIGGLRTQGIDFDVRYQLGSPVGRWGIGVEGTYLIEYTNLQPHPTEPGATYEWEFKGNYDAASATSDSNGGVYPDWRINSTLVWAMDAFNAGMNVRWISGFEECDVFGDYPLCNAPDADNPPSHDVSSNLTADLFVGYSFDSFMGESDFSIGVNNVTDQDPPKIYTGFLADSDAATYDYMGRYFYARLAHRF